ncbi:MAG: nitroreductase [Firmicutes bacterium]|nr:nitroreductase [Bacillota bacterium]
MMKQLISFLIIAVLALAVAIFFSENSTKFISNNSQPNPVVNTILSSTTTRAFTDKSVDDKTIDLIIKAGIQAPSARNIQPWHFSVVTNKEFIEKINTDTLTAGEKEAEKNPGRPKPPKDFHALFHAPIVIVISADIDSPSSTFDSALACENMSIAAQSLGLGTHIVTSVTMAFKGANEEIYRKTLGIPNDKKPVAILLIGEPNPAAADVVSKATVRNQEVVTYVK